MLELPVVIAAGLALVIIVLSEEISQGIGIVIRKVHGFVSKEGPVSDSNTFLSALLLGILIVAAVGVFTLLWTYLPYMLVETPVELPLSMTVLAIGSAMTALSRS